MFGRLFCAVCLVSLTACDGGLSPFDEERLEYEEITSTRTCDESGTTQEWRYFGAPQGESLFGLQLATSFEDFMFNVVEPGQVRVHLRSHGDSDLKIYDETGARICLSSQGGDANGHSSDVCEMDLGVGTYFIEAFAYENFYGAALTVEVQSTCDPDAETPSDMEGVLVSEQWQYFDGEAGSTTSGISTPQGYREFGFHLPGAGEGTVSLESTGDADLKLYTISGEEVCSSTNGANSSGINQDQCNVELEAGTYFIQVEGYEEFVGARLSVEIFDR